MAEHKQTKRAEALGLAEELLTDIELSRISPTDMARRASRLARLLDDDDATEWLRFEVEGWPKREAGMDASGSRAARRSGRMYYDAEKKCEFASTAPLGQLGMNVQASLAQVAAASDPDVSLHSANPNQMVFAPKGNQRERSVVRNLVGEQQGVIERVVGAIHAYVSAKHVELRFGSAVESAFEVVRADVDQKIVELVPDAMGKLSAAFENATSGNPEDWAAAAATCRRLVKACADALRPPGDPVEGREMTDDKYVNRLVDWIAQQSGGRTERGMITGDLEHLCRRLDAVEQAGHKGAHAEVSRVEASRFVTGTYLTIGDILRLRAEGEGAPVGNYDAVSV